MLPPNDSFRGVPPSRPDASLHTALGEQLSGYLVPVVGRPRRPRGQRARDLDIDVRNRRDCPPGQILMTCMARLLRTRIPGLSCDGPYERRQSLRTSLRPHFGICSIFLSWVNRNSSDRALLGQVGSPKRRALARTRQGVHIYPPGKYIGCSHLLSSSVPPHTRTTLRTSGVADLVRILCPFFTSLYFLCSMAAP